MYIRPLVSQKQIILPLFYIYAHILGLLQNPSSDESIIVTLEYTILKHGKLLDCLSDPHKHLIHQITSGTSSGASSGPVDNCFICIHVHGFPICIPSFCKKGKTLKKQTLASAEVKPLSIPYE